MENKLYLITGAAGHVGNTLVRELLARGAQVRGLILPAEKSMDIVNPRFETVRGDICDKATLEPFFTDDKGRRLVVIHTAGIVSIASKYDHRVWDVNVTGTANIIEMCERYKVSKLVYTSSVHAIPELPDGRQISEIDRFSPDDVHGLYAKTKSAATQLVLDAAARGLDASVVHPSGIVGPGDYGHGHITQMVKDYVEGRLGVCIDGGYDFVDIRDVVAGILAAAEKGARGRCYILSNRYVSVIELLNILHEATGKRKIKFKLPMWIAKATAPLAEVYYKILRQPPLFTPYSLYTLTSNANFTHARATKELGYAPRDMRVTMKDTYDWMVEHKRVVR